ncbi:MAG: hypothetical protein M1818_002442 [Claussenomyces sp. TS43310]|nr:MAG: hypothetical protein M1818_002442 [Claussenomyces sp. TS43310]
MAGATATAGPGDAATGADADADADAGAGAALKAGATASARAASTATPPARDSLEPDPNARPECFASTLQECLFVLSCTMAIGQTTFFTGATVGITATIGAALHMTSAEITWISASASRQRTESNER